MNDRGQTRGSDGIRSGIVVAMAVLLLAIGITVISRVRNRTRRLTVFAHRGFASEAPENTVAAIQSAVPRADGVEVDVRRCGSSELVCVHDSTLERVAGVSERVDELSYESIRELDVLGTNASIPRLRDVVDTVPEDVILNVELKERGLAADTLDALAEHDGPVLCSSFDPGALAEIRKYDETISLAYIFRANTERALDISADLGCDAVHPRADLCFRTALVYRAHARGLAVNAWTIDSTLEAIGLALVGVDGVIADRMPAV